MRAIVADMDLEEREGVERPGSRCEECGAPLTEQEQRNVLENGGPVLCTAHAAEVVPYTDDPDAGDEA